MAQINYSDEADYSAAREGFILNSPVAPSLIHFFDQGVFEGLRNLAMIDAAASTMVGSPAAMEGFVRFNSQSQGAVDKYIQTAVAEPAAMTALLIAKSPDTFANGDHKATIFGNYAYGNAFQGLSLVFDSDGGTLGYAEYQNGGATEQLTLAAPGQNNSDWAALAFVIEPGTGLRLHNFTIANVDASLATALPRRVAPRALRVGAVPVGYAGLADIAFIAIVPAGLSRARCEVALSPIRDYFEQKFGIIT